MYLTLSTRNNRFTVCCFCLQVLAKVDTILFSLLILHGLSDSQGHIWRCHPTHLYAVEVTLPENAVSKIKYKSYSNNFLLYDSG